MAFSSCEQCKHLSFARLPPNFTPNLGIQGDDGLCTVLGSLDAEKHNLIKLISKRTDTLLSPLELRCNNVGLKFPPFQDQCLLMDAYPLDWESLWAFIPIVCASIGICITLDVVAVFIIYNRYG